jgi:hypothetical protein
MDSAFVAFWMAGPMPFSAGSAAGVVTLAPPGVLTAGLTSALASGVTAPTPTAAQQAARIGEVLHVWSRTVVATVTPPGPPPVPIL